MSSSVFSNYSTTKFTRQPTASTGIVVRSASISESNGIFIYGTDGGTNYQSVQSILGTTEIFSATVFDSLYQIFCQYAAVGVISGYEEGTASVGDIRCDTNPADADTIQIGLRTYRFKNTLAQAYDVKIGASTNATMLSLSKAINLNGTVGTDYYTGTTINEIYSSSILTNVITITDKIPCKRFNSYVVSSASGKFSIRTPIGGEDGLLLFAIPVGSQFCQQSFILNGGDLITMTLPESVTFKSGGINTNGEKPMVAFLVDQELTVSFEISQDGAFWKESVEGQFLVNAGYSFFNLAERCENLRVLIDNASGGGCYADVRVIY